MANISLTWLGHAGFRLDGSSGKRVYIDPWLDNPKFPAGEKPIDRIDVLVITHGHSDHSGSVLEICKEHSPVVVCMTEIGDWCGNKGLDAQGINKGGTVEVDGVRVTMTDARHSSSLPDGTYAGDPAGAIVEMDGMRIYHAGDTCAFMDMQLIGRLHEPDVAILPIGDYYTMGPKEAAVALELLGVKRCVPSHYGTFPLLTGTPEELRELAPDVEIIAPEPGETIEL